MKTKRKFLKNVLAAGIVAAGMTSIAAQAYGPLYVWDYVSGTPYRWDVSNPVPVWTDGGNFASGTVSLWVETPETCNEENGWQCGYYEDLYVEFTNQQGVTRVAEALASWSDVPTSTFQAEVAGNFADVGIGGPDGDITGAPEEFGTDAQGNVVHEILGTVNNGGIHVVFDEDGSVMANVLGVPYGVLGVASPEWADEATGIITEGWVFIGGAQTYFNDADLAQMAGVITHELGHSFNLAHTQTNGHIVFYGQNFVVTPGPVDCSGHWYLGGDYQLPFPQNPGATADDVAVMYPYINTNPDAWPTPSGQYQATVSTQEDFAAIASIYPAASFAAATGSISGTVTYPFSQDGIIGVNVVARNIDDPYQDAITVMTGDWNDGVPGAAQGAGEFTLHGLTPGARYVVHVEDIFAGGFPTPQVTLPGPSEYFNGQHESDDAGADNACGYVEIEVAAGETLTGVDIQVNGVKKSPQLVIDPAPNGSEITESGQVTGGTIIDWYGAAESWLHYLGTDEYAILPMGGITLSDNGSVIGGRVVVDNAYLPARLIPGHKIELLPLPDSTPCDQGGGLLEYYSHHAISPDGSTMGGFLWNCEAPGEVGYFRASAVTYSDDSGWTVLNSHLDGHSSRVNAIANDGTTIGWSEQATGWWQGRVWKGGEELSLMDLAPEGIVEVGEATAITSDGRTVIGIEALNEFYSPRSYRYDTVTGAFEILDIAEPCPPFDWFCFGDTPFNAYDIADDGTIVGAMGRGIAMVVNEVLGAQKLTDFLKGQGVINANDLGIASAATKITTNGRHIVGWTAVDGYLGSFKLTFDQLWVCRKGKSMQVGYPGGVASQLQNGAALGMCEDDLPLQYKGNY
jgi:hypothetical protein